jgi:hypothetical protein
VLDPEVRLTVDTPDGQVVVLGATTVAARAQLAAAAAARGRAVLVDGRPGIVSWREDGTPMSVMAFTVLGGRITGIAVVADPARLASMDLPDPVSQSWIANSRSSGRGRPPGVMEHEERHPDGREHPDQPDDRLLRPAIRSSDPPGEERAEHQQTDGHQGHDGPELPHGLGRHGSDDRERHGDAGY